MKVVDLLDEPRLKIRHKQLSFPLNNKSFLKLNIKDKKNVEHYWVCQAWTEHRYKFTYLTSRLHHMLFSCKENFYRIIFSYKKIEHAKVLGKKLRRNQNNILLINFLSPHENLFFNFFSVSDGCRLRGETWMDTDCGTSDI